MDAAGHGGIFRYWDWRGNCAGPASDRGQTFAVNASAVSANGTWKLRVNDNAGTDTGKIDS